jgi:hypothetical protein
MKATRKAPKQVRPARPETESGSRPGAGDGRYQECAM